MRKYDQAMPDPTDYRGLKIKIVFGFSLLLLPVLIYFSVQALLIKDPAVERIPARTIGYSQFAGETFLRVEVIQDGKSPGTDIVSINPDDVGKYQTNEKVEIVRDPFGPSVSSVAKFVLYKDYQRRMKAGKVGQIGVIFLPFLLFAYYKFRTKPRPKLA